MKTRLYVVAFYLLILGCKNSSKEFIINGYIVNASEGLKVYLKNDHTGIFEDSLVVNNGKFLFTGIIEHPQRYELIYNQDSITKRHFVWLENRPFTINGDFNSFNDISISGGKEQDLFDKMELNTVEFDKQYSRIVEEKKFDSIEPLINSLFQKNLDFSLENINSYVGIEMLYKLRQKISKDSLKKVLENVNKDIQESGYGKSLILHTESPNLDVDSYFVDFQAKTLTGEVIKLSNILKEDKPIMLILGGLGCMREQGRNTLKTFQKKHGKNIAIIAVVFARNKQEWIWDANYPINITLLSDLKGDHSPIKIQYNVQTTPTVYLIDKKGIIQWKSLGYGEIVNDAALKLF